MKFLKWTLVSISLVTGVLILGVFLSHYLKSKSPPLGEGPLIMFPVEQISASERQLFLDGSFSLIKDVKLLPVPVLRAFTEQGGTRPVMANPRQDFQAGDVVFDPSLPWKRLIFAGVSGDKCFVHYEEGGRGHTFHLALFNLIPDNTLKPVWKGFCSGRAANLAELRSWVASEDCSQ
jgi:hypothetical protein